MLRRARPGLLALAVLPGIHCTCANTVYDRAYAGAIEAQCDAYRHEGGRAAVREDAIEVIAGQGFALDEATSSEEALRSTWREEGEVRDRVIVELSDDAAGTRVRATRAEETRSPPRWETDGEDPAPEVEAQVVRRLVPARAHEEDAALTGHGFELPARVIYDEAVRVLADRGEGVEVRAEGEPVHTVWRATVDGSARARFVVRVVDLDPTHRRVDARVQRERAIPGSRVWQPGPSRRDLELELALVDRRDPTAAASIRAGAEAEARAAYDAAVQHGAPSCGL